VNRAAWLTTRSVEFYQLGSLVKLLPKFSRKICAHRALVSLCQLWPSSTDCRALPSINYGGKFSADGTAGVRRIELSLPTERQAIHVSRKAHSPILRGASSRFLAVVTRTDLHMEMHNLMTLRSPGTRASGTLAREFPFRRSYQKINHRAKRGKRKFLRFPRVTLSSGTRLRAIGNDRT